jgi:hypothetical protein
MGNLRYVKSYYSTLDKSRSYINMYVYIYIYYIYIIYIYIIYIYYIYIIYNM